MCLHSPDGRYVPRRLLRSLPAPQECPLHPLTSERAFFSPPESTILGRVAAASRNRYQRQGRVRNGTGSAWIRLFAGISALGHSSMEDSPEECLPVLISCRLLILRRYTFASTWRISDACLRYIVFSRERSRGLLLSDAPCDHIVPPDDFL